MVMMEGEWNGVEYTHASVHLKPHPGFLDKGQDTGKLS
jgi:hypothetical protein